MHSRTGYHASGGLAVLNYKPDVAGKPINPVVWISCLMILLVLVMALLARFASPNPVGGPISLFGSRGLMAIVITVGISILCGYLLGGPQEGIRRSLSTGSAIRNTGIALLISASTFSVAAGVLIVLIAYIFIQT